MVHRRWIGAALAAVVAVALAPAGPVGAAGVGPTLGAVSPTAGPARGGNELTITGTHLSGVSAVAFGSAASLRVTHVSATLLRVRVPKHAVGTVSVQVIAGGARSPRVPDGRYAFTGPPRAMRWGGLHTVDPTRGDFAALSCGAPTFCVALDSRWPGRAQLVSFRPAGPGVATPVPAKGLDGVYCASATYCVAGEPSAATEWDGQTWSPMHRLADWRVADAVSCAPQTSLCVMLGDTDSLVHLTDGWHTVATPYPGSGFSLSCATATFCLATDGPRTMRFDGTRWTTDSRNDDPPEYVEGLSCSSANYCMVAGGWQASEWDPLGWTALPSRLPLDDAGAPACVADSDCILNSIAGTVRWDGRVLHRVRYPGGLSGATEPSCVPGFGCVVVDRAGHEALWTAAHRWTAVHDVVAAQGDLVAVSCASRSWCVAVDTPGNALSWRGTRWSAPSRIDDRGSLTSVSCASRSFCAAVGTHAVTRTAGRWRAPVHVDSRQLTDVSCPMAKFCVAVDMGGRAVTWRGHGWSKPVRVTGQELDAVSCPDATHCLAVGYRSAQWSGGRWHPVANPEHAWELTDVDCASADYCTAGGVGGFFVRHGGLWSSAVRPTRGIDAAWVSCMSARYCLGEADIYEGTDVEDYVLDGASVRSRDYRSGGYTSCTPGLCVSVEGDSVDMGRS